MIYSINVLKSLSRRRRKMRDSYIVNVKMLVSAGVAVGALFLGGAVVSADEYTVQQGDTVWDIAQAHDTTIENIENLNPTIDKTTHLIQIGDKLELDSDNTQVQTVQQDEVQVDSASVSNASYYSYNKQVNTQSPVVSQPVQQPKVEAPKTNGGSAQDWIAQRESGGSYTAQNGQYYGKYQLSLDKLHGDLSPANQEKVANDYAVSRYGSWENAQQAWQAKGWW